MGNRQHIDAKGIFQLRFFIKNIFNFVNVRILFQLQNNADSFFAGLVGNIYHICQLLTFHQIGHVHQKFVNARANHSIGNFADD